LSTIREGYLALGKARRRSCTLYTARRRNNARGERDPRSLVQQQANCGSRQLGDVLSIRALIKKAENYLNQRCCKNHHEKVALGISPAE
jgi:hypothetical protein